jgi:ribose/xylose/arabinose/galactoside ABC-type transport system permease subunit
MQPYVLAISLALMIVVAAAFGWALRHTAADAQVASSGQVESYAAAYSGG